MEGLADALREAGIPGVKYLDQGSRGAGEGSRNYAIWDQDVLDRMKLLQRNDETFKSVPGVPVMGLIEQPGGLDIMGQYTGGVI